MPQVLTTKLVRQAIFQIRPEWKKLKRISVRYNGTHISLMIGLLEQETIDIFDAHGTLKENATAIGNKLRVKLSQVHRSGRCEEVHII